MTLSVKLVSWQDASETLSQLRNEVFIQEQNVSQALEWDGLDDREDTHHFLGYLNDTPIATARILNDGQIGRVCVLKAYRRQGYGSEILKTATQTALIQNLSPWLNAQIAALDLYTKHGYVSDGKQFLDADILHERMTFNPSDANALEAVFGRQIIRPQAEHEYASHLTLMTQSSRRAINILSHTLSEHFFNRAVCDAISEFARRHRQTQVRILLTESDHLNGRYHPLVTLMQRLPSSIAIHLLDKEVVTTQTSSFAVFDAQRFVFFDDEKACDGYVTYKAAPQAQSYMEYFENLWQRHSAPDPNLAQLSL